MKQVWRQLPGCWQIVATDFPMWLKEKRRNPTITYGLLEERPLTLSDEVAYRDKRGRRKVILGADTETRDGFLWRGRGLLKPLHSRWQVLALEGDMLVIRFEKSLLSPAGLDVLVRNGVSTVNAKRQLRGLAHTAALTHRELCGLHWL